MDHRALDDALEPGGGFGILLARMNQALQLAIDVVPERAAQGLFSRHRVVFAAAFGLVHGAGFADSASSP